jgi:hypothetical protein
LIALIKFGGVKLRSSSLCNFLHPPVNSSLVGQYIVLSFLFSTPWIYILSFMRQTKFHTYEKEHAKFYILCEPRRETILD